MTAFHIVAIIESSLAFALALFGLLDKNKEKQRDTMLFAIFLMLSAIYFK